MTDAPPTEPAVTPPARARAKRLAVPRSVRRLAFWAAVVGLIGLNAWWLVRERWPVADLATIQRWVAFRKYDAAEFALRQRLGRSPHDGEARMLLARVLGARQDYLGCARELHEVPAWWPAKAEAAFLEAEAYKGLNLMRHAEAAWWVCIAGDPLHPVPPRLLSASARALIGLYILEYRLDEARATIWKVYEQADPIDLAPILIMRIRAELERIENREAAATLRSYLKADPNDFHARRGLAHVELLQGHLAEAAEHAQACVTAQPNDPGHWREWLDVLYARGDRDGVVAALERLPQSADADPVLWKYRGMAREWAGDLAAAVEAYRRAIELKPDEGEFHYKLAMVEERLDRPDIARRHRRQNEDLTRARSDLNDAYVAYLDAVEAETPSEPKRRAAINRLIAACQALGWPREATAWRQELARLPD